MPGSANADGESCGDGKICKAGVCEDDVCGRRVVVHRAGGMTVLDRGDFFAHHVGGNEGLDVTVV